MRYEILGQPRVANGNDWLIFSPGKIRILLRVLVIRADCMVSSDQLITEMWEENAPIHASQNLYVYICRLRKILKRFTTEGSSPIITDTPGYRLVTAHDEVDLRDFKKLIRAGRAHMEAGRFQKATDALEAALARCRGAPLIDIGGGPIIKGFIPWLEEAQLECTEKLFEAKLMLGRHRQLIADLNAMTRRHVLRESFYRQLMLALYRSDRQADALNVYQTARGFLNEHLGVEPGQALQDLQRAILAADKRLYVPSCTRPF